MHSVCVSSQLLVSVLFIAVPTNTENFEFFLYLFKEVWQNLIKWQVSLGRIMKYFACCRYGEKTTLKRSSKAPKETSTYMMGYQMSFVRMVSLKLESKLVHKRIKDGLKTSIKNGSFMIKLMMSWATGPL